MHKRFKTDLNTDIEFMNALYKTRKENLKIIMENVSPFNYIKYVLYFLSLPKLFFHYLTQHIPIWFQLF